MLSSTKMEVLSRKEVKNIIDNFASNKENYSSEQIDDDIYLRNTQKNMYVLFKWNPRFEFFDVKPCFNNGKKEHMGYILTKNDLSVVLNTIKGRWAYLKS